MLPCSILPTFSANVLKGALLTVDTPFLLRFETKVLRIELNVFLVVSNLSFPVKGKPRTSAILFLTVCKSSFVVSNVSIISLSFAFSSNFVAIFHSPLLNHIY